ncbi:MAG: ornithine cyclodeaminase family protein [Bacteroidota bacterium]
MPTKQTLVIASQDIETIIHHLGIDRVMDELIERTHHAFLTFNPEQTQIPTRSGFHYTTPHTGLVEWMPLYKKEEEVVIKVVGYHPQNPDIYQLPTILSTISAYDTASGHLIGLMDGVLPTALRTGAASAVASRSMAHPDSKVLGLIGCGAQSVTQLHALSRVFELEKVLIYDSDRAAVESFQIRVAPLNIDVEILSSSITDIVAQSDIVCTATSIDVGEGPLFDQITPKETVHFNAVGADFPGKIELPKSLLLQSFVCPDFKGQAVVEGECQQLEEKDIAVNLDQVIKQSADYQYLKSQQTVFDSTGFALEDQIVMDFFLQQALTLGIGQEIEVESSPTDAKNPYTFLQSSPTADALLLTQAQFA